MLFVSGFVGLFNALLLWPGLLLVHYTHAESFEIPTLQQLQFLFINGVIGTVLSELLWLWGCFYTSSLVATLAISLTIPLTIVADIVWKQKQYGMIFFVGAVPMFLSFFLVAMLTHFQDWDPVMDLLKKIFGSLKRLCPSLRSSGRSAAVYVHDRDESESLITNQQDSSHEEL